MSAAFVLGNGVSRKQIDPEQLRSWGKIYGCNALYREFVPDVLVATDRGIREQIQTSGYSMNNRFYTRSPVLGSGAHEVPAQYWSFSSGQLALAIAAQDGAGKIYLLGFDLGPDNQLFNNVYASTEFYKPLGANPTYTGNWIKQIAQVTVDFPHVEFVRVQGATTTNIPEFARLVNFKHVPIAQFQNCISSGQGL